MWSLKFNVADTYIPCSSQKDHSEMEAATAPPGFGSERAEGNQAHWFELY